ENTDDTADTSTLPGSTTDEHVLRAVIEGQETDLIAALSQVAWSDGLPAHTAADTWLFVTPAGAMDGPLSIAGDFNAWTPAPMTRAGGLHWIELAIADPEGQRYKFVDGDAWRADPWARAYEYDE